MVALAATRVPVRAIIVMLERVRATLDAAALAAGAGDLQRCEHLLGVAGDGLVKLEDAIARLLCRELTPTEAEDHATTDQT